MGVLIRSLVSMVLILLSITPKAYAIDSTSLTFTGEIDFVLPQVQYSTTDNPVSLVKNLTVEITNTSDANGCSLVTSSPATIDSALCLFEWIDVPTGYSNGGFSITGLPMSEGQFLLSYKLSLLNSGDPVELLTESISIDIGAPDAPQIIDIDSEVSVIAGATPSLIVNHLNSNLSPRFNVNVMDRPFDQRIKLVEVSSSQKVSECTVTAGETSCSLSVPGVDSSVTGAIGPYVLEIASTNDLLVGVSPITNIDLYWDFQPPSIAEVLVYSPNDSADDYKSFSTAYGSVTLAKNEAGVLLTSHHEDATAMSIMPDSVSFELDSLNASLTLNLTQKGSVTVLGSGASKAWLYTFDLGNSVPDGNYTPKISGSDKNSNYFSDNTDQIALDRIPPEIKLYYSEKANRYQLLDDQVVFIPEQLVVYANDGYYSDVDVTEASIDGILLSWNRESDNYFRIAATDKINLAGKESIDFSVTVVDQAGNPTTYNQKVILGNVNYSLNVPRFHQKDVYQRYLSKIQMSLKSESGFYCPLTFNDVDAQRFIDDLGYKYTCLVEFDLPDGMERDRSSISGTFNVTGHQARVGFKVYAFTSSSKVEIDSNETFFDLVNPDPPSVKMWSSDYLDLTVDLGDDKFELYKDGLYKCASNSNCVQSAEDVQDQLPLPEMLFSSMGGKLGTINVNGTSSQIVIEMYKEGSLVESWESSSLGRFYRVIYDKDTAKVFTESNYEIKAYYKALPTISTSFKLKTYRVPPNNIYMTTPRIVEAVLSNKDITIDVDLGTRNLADRSMEFKGTDLYGEWDVYLAKKDRNVFVPISDVVTINDSGKASIPVDIKGISHLSYYAIANLRAPKDHLTREIKTRYNYFAVIKAFEVEAENTPKKLSGIIPFRFSSGIKYATQSDRNVSSGIEWQISYDSGDTWVPQNDFNEKNAFNYVFEEVGLYHVRTKLVNKHTNLVSYTPVTEINAFYTPKVRLSGSNVLFINDSMDLKVTLDGEAAVDNEVEVYWSFDGSDFQPGSSVSTVQHLELGRHYVTAKVRTKSSDPENTASWAQYTFRYNVIEPSQMYVNFTSPAEFEVGKKYELIAKPRINASIQNELKTVWSVNSGAPIDSSTLSYTADASDITIKNKNEVISVTMEAWYEGFKQQTKNTITKDIRTWEYRFPNFSAEMNQTSLYAPAKITLTANPLTPMHRVTPQYLWDLGEINHSLDRSKSKLIFDLSEPGIYPISLLVTDERGNQSIANEVIEVKQPDPYEITLNLTPGNSSWREPFSIRSQALITGGHPDDRVATVISRVFDSQGVEVANYNRDHVYAKNLVAGDYETETEFISAFGQVVNKKTTFSVGVNNPPVCSFTEDPMGDTTMFYVSCTDDGSISSYKWFINENGVRLTGQPNTRIYNSSLEDADVYVVIRDDGGKETTLSVREK